MNITTTDNYLAVFLGNQDNPKMQAWQKLPEAEQKAVMTKGIAAWHAWVEKHKASIIVMGGPLGKTKKISPNGIEDVKNDMSGYTVVRASSHEEAAKMFENHPHFTDFPGVAVEVMPVLAVPDSK